MNFPRRPSRGFTLIELLITVAVVAILVSVAYPSYTAHVLKSRRAEAQQVLMDAASRQQQWLLDTRRYATEAELKAGTGGLNIPNSVAANYTLVFDAPVPAAGVAPTFTITATPQGAQDRDTCKPLTIANTGVKTPATCW
ncbi:type IV pilin protein [Ramlibacter sp. AW1]|uniref:Type IV pilin protein n=1 Tax=Ramlibacter aurantiacus TaxID=2801330 RepID=A0A937D701_9BURK|nr:type IV pilin protein [Ramlibacter aurantiacus]MBL0422827.1 type IV pilin protein [Ramlibacter aurantiacus]